MQDLGRFFRTLRRVYRAIAILALNTIVIVVGLNAAATVMLATRSNLSQETSGDPRQYSSYYRSQEWAGQFWREFSLARKQQYQAFTVWREKPFKGETINIDA